MKQHQFTEPFPVIDLTSEFRARWEGEPDWFQEYEQWLDETQPEIDE